LRLRAPTHPGTRFIRNSAAPGWRAPCSARPMRLLSLTSLASLIAACGGATTSSLGGPYDASSGDASGPAVVLDCVPDAGVASTDPGDPAVQDTLSGTNGVFTDSCDPQGNLVDYSCETATTCGPGPNPGCSMVDTGRVVPQSIDCSGHCVNGRCDGRCPSIGQGYHFVAVGPAGAATLMNDSDGRTYVHSHLRPDRRLVRLHDRPDRRHGRLDRVARSSWRVLHRQGLRQHRRDDRRRPRAGRTELHLLLQHPLRGCVHAMRRDRGVTRVTARGGRRCAPRAGAAPCEARA
jgi:hypothetical protein